MLPLGRPWAVARFSRIFGGFPRFLTRYLRILDVYHGQRRAGRRPVRPGRLPVITASGSPDRGCRLPDRGCRLPVAGSRPADHRIAVAGDRC